MENQDRSVVETTKGIRKEIRRLSENTGISSKRLTTLLLQYAIDAAKKTPTILTAQIAKDMKTS